MRKPKNFRQLVSENKQELLRNNKAIAKIEKKIDERISKKEIS